MSAGPVTREQIVADLDHWSEAMADRIESGWMSGDAAIAFHLIEELRDTRAEVERLRAEVEHSREIVGAYLSAWSGAIPVSWSRTLRPHAADIPVDGAFVVLDQHLNLLDATEATS